MGISVKMITGDQLLIGKETAKQLGMGTNMFTTEALLKVGGPVGWGCAVWVCWVGSGCPWGGRRSPADAVG